MLRPDAACLRSAARSHRRLSGRLESPAASLTGWRETRISLCAQR